VQLRTELARQRLRQPQALTGADLKKFLKDKLNPQEKPQK
jgi:hypothetical protein